jgi:hypothetical protein
MSPELDELLARLDEAAALALGAPDGDPRYSGAVALLREQACAAGADLCPPPPPREELTATGGLAVSVLPGTAVPLPGGWTWRNGSELADVGRWIPGLRSLDAAGDGLVAMVVDHLIHVGPSGTRVVALAARAGHATCHDLVSERAAVRLSAPNCYDGSPWTATVLDPVTGAARGRGLEGVTSVTSTTVNGGWLAAQSDEGVVLVRVPTARRVRAVAGETVALGADGTVAVRREPEQVWLSRPDGREQAVALSSLQSLFLLGDGGWVVVSHHGVRYGAEQWSGRSRFRVELVGADGVVAGVVDWEGPSSMPTRLVEHPDGSSFALGGHGGDLLVARPGRTAAVVPVPSWLDRPFPALAALHAPLSVDGVPRRVDARVLVPQVLLVLPEGADPRSLDELMVGPRIGPRTWMLEDPETVEWPVLVTSRPLVQNEPMASDLRMWAWSAPGAAVDAVEIGRAQVVDEAGRPLAGVPMRRPDRDTFLTDGTGGFGYWPNPYGSLPEPVGPDGRWLDHLWSDGRVVVTGPPATPRPADGTQWGGAWERWEDGVLHTVWIPPDEVRSVRPGFGRTEDVAWFGDATTMVWADGRRYTRRVAPHPERRVVLGEQRWLPGDGASVTGRVRGRPIRGELVVRGALDESRSSDAREKAVWMGDLSATLTCDECVDLWPVLRWALLTEDLEGLPLEDGVLQMLPPRESSAVARTARWEGEEPCGHTTCVLVRIDDDNVTSRLLVERDPLRPRSWEADGVEVAFEWRSAANP